MAVIEFVFGKFNYCNGIVHNSVFIQEHDIPTFFSNLVMSVHIFVGKYAQNV